MNHHSLRELWLVSHGQHRWKAPQALPGPQHLSASHVSFFGRCLRHKELGRVGSWRASLQTCHLDSDSYGLRTNVKDWKNRPYSPGMSRIGNLPPEIRLFFVRWLLDLTKSTSYFWSREARFDTIPNPSSIGLHEKRHKNLPFLFMAYHTNCPIVWWSESYLVPSPGWEAPPQAMGRSASRSRDGAASNGKDKGGDGKRDLALGISGFHGRFMVVLLGDWMVITSLY